MAIDMHCHWAPRGLIRRSKAQKDWYGWRILHDASGREMVSLGDRVTMVSASKSSLEDPAARATRRKEEEGVDMQTLIVTGNYFNYHLDEADAATFCREVNEEVSEVQAAFPQHYRGVAVLPVQHPQLALREMEYAAGNLGLRTVVIGSSVRGLNLDEPTMLPVIERAVTMGLSVIVHPIIWDKIGENRLPRYYFSNSFGAPLESSLAVMSIVYSGLLDRHPHAKLMFTQGGGWIQFGVGRLQLRYQQRPDARPMARPPLDYLSQLYFDCLVHDVDSLELLVRRAGVGHVFVGTDFPAGGDILGGAVKWIKECSFLSPQDKEKILFGNARKFLGLDS
jgi:aminocarboxymuconate-semialdehyde decarboxylase